MKQFIVFICGVFMATISANVSIGHRYIDFLHKFKEAQGIGLSQEIDDLFSPDMIKVVNSKRVCENRKEAFAQMEEVRSTYQPHSIKIHEYVDAGNQCVIRWEIGYADNTTESVITIVSANQDGLITEINEVFGEKEVYNWPENKKSLNEIAQSYLNFVNNVGGGLISHDDTIIQTLFAPNLTKIDNNTILFANNRDLLLPQMYTLKKEGSQLSKLDWTVDLDAALIIPSLETNSVVVNFQWSHTKAGNGLTSALLICNNNNQIEKIVDVWSRMESITNHQF